MVLPTQSVADNIRNAGNWRNRIESEYAREVNRLQQAYDRVLRRLRVDLATLQTELARFDELGGATAQDIRDSAAWTRFLNRVRDEMGGYASVVANTAGSVQETGIAAGQAWARDMALTSAGGLAPVVAEAWSRIPPDILANLIDYVDGEAMQSRFRAFGDSAAQNIADTVLAYTAKGRGSVATGRVISTWFSVPFAWSESMTRTVQAWSVRTATHATYRANSNIVSGWMWWAALDARVCVSCVNQHGTTHSVNEVLNDHHRGRCTPLPIIRGSTWPDTVQPGRDWFAGLPEARQRALMGPGLWDLWRDGTATWQDMSVSYTDGVYGEMLRATTIKRILGRP